MMNQRGSIVAILMFLVVIAGLAAAVFLLKSDKLQIFKSRASENPITLVGRNVNEVNGVWQTTDPTVEFELHSDLAPAVSR